MSLLSSAIMTLHISIPGRMNQVFDLEIHMFHKEKIEIGAKQEKVFMLGWLHMKKAQATARARLQYIIFQSRDNFFAMNQQKT